MVPTAIESLDQVVRGTPLRGFEPVAIYVDDAGRSRGGRFVHARTRFVFDYLRVESAPQAFVWATTYPASDDGAPHTQEHLLLGHGNKGRYLGNFEHAMLAQSGAHTSQFRTVYAFHTVGGIETFWPLLRTNLDALLHPDYSDEEIRREVRDFGVAKAPNGALALTEKGTVYGEMLGRFDDPSERTWFELARMIYGADHPLAFVSGGTPEGIRTLTPEKIRAFHAAHYRLGNMGVIGAFPATVPFTQVLDRLGQTLDALAEPGAPTRFKTEADLPPPHVAEAAALRVVDYPYATTDHAGPMTLAWPATRKLPLGERWALDGFLAAFGSGSGSTLYSALVDRKTATLDVGATDVWCGRTNDPGNPVYVGLSNVSASHADEASLRAVREVVLARLREIAALPDGSPALAEFQGRYRSHLLESQRWVDKFLDTPPEFGARATGDAWIDHLDRNVNGEGDFRRSLSTRDAQTFAFGLAAPHKNPWRERMRAWGLLDPPSGVVARPSPDLRKLLDAAREERLGKELSRLKSTYGTQDEQEALRRRAAEIARGDEEIARAEAAVAMPPFIADPPMTADDGLVWKEGALSGVPVVTSTFQTMKSATVGLALRLDAVPEELLPYVAILPALMREVGVVRDGVPISYAEVRDRLRREVLSVDVFSRVRFSKKSAELVLEGSGNDVEETRRAIAWMRDFLTSPDWRVENLPRIRDVVKERTKSLRSVMTSPEEHWVKQVSNAYWREDEPFLAHAGLFLTRAHDAFRLSWRIEGTTDDKELSRYLQSLATAGKKADRAALAGLARALADVEAPPPRKDLAAFVALARALPVGARAHVSKVGLDLGELLSDVPDESLAGDWAAICKDMAADAEHAPADALAALGKTLAAIRHANVARAWVVGSVEHQAKIEAELRRLLEVLDATPAPFAQYAPGGRIVARARERGASVKDPTFAALVDPNRANASLDHTAPGVTYSTTSDAALVDYLAANVFGGIGGHSFYKRIWGAGLAYSGYASTSPASGRIQVYSDRCADLAQLLRFSANEVRAAPEDPRFVDYTVTTAFWSRIGQRYETRADSLAEDLASGDTPDRVRAFRARLLALRQRPDAAAAIHARVAPVYASLLPSVAAGASRPAGALWFTMGPEAQIAAYERELRASLGEGTTVLRLYPRDFW